jgi:hypothetical protein
VALRALDALRRRSHQLALFTAWHAAALSRIERMPDLAPLIEEVAGHAPEDQNPEEQMAAARAIALAFGGDPGKGA